MNTVPVVSLSEHRSVDPVERARCASALRDSLCRLGFVRVEDHGIDPGLVGRVYRHFERFFLQEDCVKQRCSGVAGGQRGYTPFGVEHAKDHAAPDLKEFFHLGRADAAYAGFPENVWPAELPELREDGQRLFEALERCAVRILELLADSFGLPRDAFAGSVIGGNSVLRAVHYPPVSLGRNPASLRAAPHEDINLITLLCEATDAGLEIRPPGSQRWIPVEAPPGQIVVDSGDMLSRMTNDVIPATTHRVVSPPGGAERSRYALPFFAHPRPECDLSPLPLFVTADRPRRHPAVTAGTFLSERLREIGLVS